MSNIVKISIVAIFLVFAGAAYRLLPDQTTDNSAINAHLVGEMASITVYEAPKPLPDYSIQIEDGTEIKMSDLKGRVLLINLWASWCAPCRAEMKDIAELQEILGGPDFEVVALNEDRGGLKKAKITLEEWGVEGLNLYADKSMKTGFSMAGGKLPTSYIVDKNGMMIAEYVGPLDWASTESLALFRKLMQ